MPESDRLQETDLIHLWRCSGCGTEYTADGICGQNQPFYCREELMPVTQAEQLTDVVAAIRIAVEATDNWEKLGKVAKAIVETAPDTPDDNTGGLELLMRLQRANTLVFELDCNDD